MDIRSFPRPPREPGSLKPVQQPLEPASRSSRSAGRRRRQAVREEKAKIVMMRTVALGGIALVGLIAIVAVGMFREKHAGTSVWVDPNIREAAKMKSFGIAVPSQEETIAIVQKALAIRKIADVGDHLRLDGMSAEETVEFFSRLEEKNGKIMLISCDQTLNANGLQIESVRVNFEQEGLTRTRMAFLTPNSSGIWQFDMPSFARKQSVGWEEVLKGPVQEVELRVHTASDSYYNGPYRDEQAWSGYGLSSEDTETLVQGYCPRGGQVDEALKFLLRSRSPARVMVRFQRSEIPGSRQGEIKSVLAEGWVRTDVPFDERLAKESPSTGIEAGQAE